MVRQISLKCKNGGNQRGTDAGINHQKSCHAEHARHRIYLDIHQRGGKQRIQYCAAGHDGHRCKKEPEHHQQWSDHTVYQVDVTISSTASPVLACSQMGCGPQGAGGASNQYTDYPVTDAGHPEDKRNKRQVNR